MWCMKIIDGIIDGLVAIWDVIGETVETLFVIAFYGGIIWGIFLLYSTYQESTLQKVSPHISGHIVRPLFGQPTFEVHVWHQYPGDVKNGQLVATAKGNDVTCDEVSGDEPCASRIHSFETWEPNQENKVIFQIPLSRYNSETEIQFGLLLSGNSIKQYRISDEWTRDGWKSSQ